LFVLNFYLEIYAFEISKAIHFKNNTFHNWDETASQIHDRLSISIAKSLMWWL